MMEFFLRSVADPSPASYLALAAAIVVVAGGFTGWTQSLREPRSNVALIYGGAGHLAVVLLFAIGQGTYAFDMLLANGRALSMAAAERAAFVAEASHHAEASFAFIGLGSAIAFVMATALLLRSVWLRRGMRLPEGATSWVHALERKLTVQ